MTTVNCDFCGDKIPEGEGDPVTLADVESIPEARKDACSTCTAILWAAVKAKSLRQLAEARKDSERLDWLGQNDTSWTRIAWRVFGPGYVEVASTSPDGKHFHANLREAIDAAMEIKP